jgi:hypothetical protein
LLLRDQLFHLLHPELNILSRSIGIAPLQVASPRQKSVPLLETSDESWGTGERVWIPPEICPLLCGHYTKGIACEWSLVVQITGENPFRDVRFVLICEETVVPAMVYLPVPRPPGLVFAPFPVPSGCRAVRNVR